MRTGLLAAVAACLVARVAVRADDQAEVQALIDKAIQARGGADKLAKFKAATWKGKGKFYGLGEGIDFTGDWAVQPPTQTRYSLEMDVGGMKIQRLAVVNGDKGWIKLNDMLQEMDKEQLAEEKAQAQASRVTSLLTLKEKEYQLSPLGEAKVGDRPAAGVRVSHKDQRDINLYFDK